MFKWEKKGVIFFKNTPFIARKGSKSFLSSNSRIFHYEKLINCAGLYADKIAKQFGAFFIKDEVNQSAVGYLVTHTGYAYLLDREGRVRKMFSSKVDVPEMIETVNLLLKP